MFKQTVLKFQGALGLLGFGPKERKKMGIAITVTLKVNGMMMSSPMHSSLGGMYSF